MDPDERGAGGNKRPRSRGPGTSPASQISYSVWAAPRRRSCPSFARVAHRAERNLPKVEAASSSLATCSKGDPMKRYWTMAEALRLLPERTKEAIFDLVIEGALVLDPEALGVLADWAYPPDTEAV